MIPAFLFSPLGRWIAGVAIALTALCGAYYHVKGTGYAECKSEWNAANANNIVKGTAARADGERDAADGVPDGFDRDK